MVPLSVAQVISMDIIKKELFLQAMSTGLNTAKIALLPSLISLSSDNAKAKPALAWSATSANQSDYLWRLDRRLSRYGRQVYLPIICHIKAAAPSLRS